MFRSDKFKYYEFIEHSGPLRCTHVVVWIEDSGDVFCQVSVQNCFNIISSVNCGAETQFRSNEKALDHMVLVLSGVSCRDIKLFSSLFSHSYQIISEADTTKH